MYVYIIPLNSESCEDANIGVEVVKTTTFNAAVGIMTTLGFLSFL